MGAGGRPFKSARPDQFLPASSFQFLLLALAKNVKKGPKLITLMLNGEKWSKREIIITKIPGGLWLFTEAYRQYSPVGMLLAHPAIKAQLTGPNFRANRKSLI